MSNVKTFSFIALGIIAVSFILMVVGVATDGWVFIDGVNWLVSLKILADGNWPKGQASYAMGIIATLGAATALTALSIQVVMQQIDQASEKLSPVLLLVTVIGAGLGGACGIIASVIQVAAGVYTVSYMPGYSFFLTIIGSLLLLIGGAMARKAKQGGQAVGV